MKRISWRGPEYSADWDKKIMKNYEKRLHQVSYKHQETEAQWKTVCDSFGKFARLVLALKRFSYVFVQLCCVLF